MCSLQKTLQIRILLGKSFHQRYNLILYDQYFVFVPLQLLPCQNNRENPAPAILRPPAPAKYWPRSDYADKPTQIFFYCPYTSWWHKLIQSLLIKNQTTYRLGSGKKKIYLPRYLLVKKNLAVSSLMDMQTTPPPPLRSGRNFMKGAECAEQNGKND